MDDGTTPLVGADALEAEGVPEEEDPTMSTQVCAVRTTDQTEIQEFGHIVRPFPSYANLVAYKASCLQNTTLGNQILAAAAMEGCLGWLQNLARVEVFFLGRFMPAVYLLNIGGIALVYCTNKEQFDAFYEDDYAYNDDDKAQVNNNWIYYYGILLFVAFCGSMVPLVIDFMFWIAIDRRLKAAFQ